MLIFLLLSCGSIIKEKEYSNPELHFGVIADCQYWDNEGVDSRKYSKSIKKLEECVGYFNSKDLSFTIHLGDFIDREWESFNKIIPISRKLHSSFYQVLGNHDFAVIDEKNDQVREKLNMSSDYYDFKVENWRFIVLNGNDISFYAYPKGSEMYEFSSVYYKRNKIESPVWNGAISETQMDWFKRVLSGASKRNEKVIVFCHFPVYPNDLVHNLWNSDEIIEAIESYSCVKAYINGHNHKGNYGIKNGVHYLTLKGMVETDENSYAIIKLHDNIIEVKGYGREENRILEILH